MSTDAEQFANYDWAARFLKPEQFPVAAFHVTTFGVSSPALNINVVVLGRNAVSMYSKSSRDSGIAKEVIEGILDAKDILGYQVSSAHGICSEEDADAQIDAIMARSGYRCPINLLDKVAWLAETVDPTRLDSSLVATAFRLNFAEAERALCEVAARIERETAALQIKHHIDP